MSYMFLFSLYAADNTSVASSSSLLHMRNFNYTQQVLADHGKHNNNNTQESQLRFSSVCILMRRTSCQCPWTTEVEGQNESYSGSGSPGAWHIQQSIFKKQTNKTTHTHTHLQLNSTPLCCSECTERRKFVRLWGESVMGKCTHKQLLHCLVALSRISHCKPSMTTPITIPPKEINGIHHSESSTFWF